MKLRHSRVEAIPTAVSKDLVHPSDIFGTICLLGLVAILFGVIANAH
jgi:hypothetical protein